MTRSKPDFRRILLQLPHSGRDYAAVTSAARLAELLGVSLVGTYFEEAGLMDVAALPGAREFRTGSWQSLTADQLARDFAAAAQEAERRFGEATRHHKAAASFAHSRGSGVDLPTASPDDIIAIIEPKNPIERATHQFSALMRAALRSTAAILLLPSLDTVPSGPVVVTAAGSDDPNFITALEIARCAGESIVIIPSGPPDQMPESIVEAASAAGVAARLAQSQPALVEDMVAAHAKGSLLVTGRTQFAGAHRRGATGFRMPVLLLSTASD